MTVAWLKCVGDAWCELNNLNLSHSHFNNLEGVYIIWHGGQNPATVYVGQGNIRDRLSEHRGNANIQAFGSLGLFVTWAEIPVASRGGVEKFLAEYLRQKVGTVHPLALPIPVNLPW